MVEGKQGEMCCGLRWGQVPLNLCHSDLQPVTATLLVLSP